MTLISFIYSSTYISFINVGILMQKDMQPRPTGKNGLWRAWRWGVGDVEGSAAGQRELPVAHWLYARFCSVLEGQMSKTIA